MNIILSINGGLGKSIVATAVCSAIKNNYPSCKLYVITGYPDVFSNVDSVDMAFPHNGEHYFYSKYIENQEYKIFANEPYLVTEHIQGKEHLIETWCKMNGIAYNGEGLEVNINDREEMYFQNKYTFDKELMILQTHGGGNQEVKYSWSRDMPNYLINKIIERYKDKYTILHIRREDQFGYNFTTPIHETYKGIASLIRRSSKRVLIDSFCQHLSCALNKKATVLWISNKPNVFGYSMHDNILANDETQKPDLRNALFTKYNIGGALMEYPYKNETDIFDVEKVFDSIDRQ